jgi:DnaK suppressor protein
MGHLSAEEEALLRRAIEAEMESINGRHGQSVEARELLNEPIDLQERATLETDRQRVFTLGTREQARLFELQAALSRMMRGEYGICEESDEPIPFGRLRENPAARYCAEVQQEMEEHERRQRVIYDLDEGDAY